MKQYFLFFTVLFSFFMFISCDVLKSVTDTLGGGLGKELENIKQLKEENLKGHTITWLIFADDTDVIKSGVYKKAGEYYAKTSNEANFAEYLQIIVISDAIESVIKSKVKQAGFDADCFPLKWNGEIKNKYNPDNKKNFSVFFDKNGTYLFSVDENWKIQNYDGLKNYIVNAAGLSNISDLANPIKLAAAVKKLEKDPLFVFVSEALGFNIESLLRIFLS